MSLIIFFLILEMNKIHGIGTVSLMQSVSYLCGYMVSKWFSLLAPSPTLNHNLSRLLIAATVSAATP